MIWNNEILFLHVPKTGGMSVTEFLLQSLRGPVSYTSDSKHPKGKRAKFIKGSRHETLADAESYFTYRGRSIYDFEAIFAVMRNPYDLEVSRYSYLRQGNKVDRGVAQDLAMDGDFGKYLRNAPFFGAFPPRLDRYFQLGNSIPPQMRILRNERLDADLDTHLAPYLLKRHAAVPRINTSQRDSWTDYYDEATEALCYERHRWFFDLGFYPRHLAAYQTEPEPEPEPDPEPRPPFPAEIPEDLLGDSWLGGVPLETRARRVSTRLLQALDGEELRGRRILDLGSAGALGRHVADRRRIAGYLGLEPAGPLLDFLRPNVHDERMRYGALSLRHGYASAIVMPTTDGVDPEESEPFDTVWLDHVFTHLEPTDIVAVLRFCRSTVTDDAVLAARVHLMEPSEAKSTLFDLMVAYGAIEEDTDLDMAGPSDTGDIMYSRTRVIEMAEAGGWAVEGFLDADTIHRHSVVLRPGS